MHDILGSYLFLCHPTGQRLDAQISSPNTDRELNDRHGDHRGVHGSQQSLMDEKFNQEKKHLLLFKIIFTPAIQHRDTSKLKVVQ